MNEQVTLVLFCKRPGIGHGKQRLASTVGQEHAYKLADKLLNCALEDLNDWPGPIAIVPENSKDEDWAVGLLKRDKVVVFQGEGNMGQRLNHIDQELRTLGYRKQLIIGSDAPVLSRSDYCDAANQLLTSDVVFSKADDGGVTLMGSCVPWPKLEALPWSSDKLGEALVNTCRDQGLSVGYVDSSYDVDYWHDLTKLKKDLQLDCRPARKGLLQMIIQVEKVVKKNV